MSAYNRLHRKVIRRVYRRDYGDVTNKVHRGVMNVTVHMSQRARELMVQRDVHEARLIRDNQARGRALLDALNLLGDR